MRRVGLVRVHEGRGGARAVSRHAARAVGSSRRDALGRRAGGKGGRGEAGARSKMAVQESAAQLSMTLKVQEYPTLKVGAGPPPGAGGSALTPSASRPSSAQREPLFPHVLLASGAPGLWDGG